jgi:gluconate kinase
MLAAWIGRASEADGMLRPLQNIAQRIAGRRGHFMPVRLLNSQFATLEPPTAEGAPIVVPIDRPVAAIVEHVVTALSSPKATMTAASMRVPA